MLYSGTAFLALLVHIIINFHVIRNTHYMHEKPAAKAYRGLILSVMAFYIFDALWGIVYDTHIISAAFLDTELYFVAMAATVFFWTRFAIRFLNEKNRFLSFISSIGWMMIGFFGVILILNAFYPVMFWFDAEGIYHAGNLRYLALTLQVILFMSTSVYILLTFSNRTDARIRLHYAAIGAFGITMSVMVVLQVLFPLLPLYTAGCLLGNCILHTFIINAMMDDRRMELEETLRREKRQEQELGSVRKMAYTDSLTGVKSTHAYIEAEEQVDRRIANGEIEEFGVIVFDVNGLKNVNDTKGHDAGDLYIQQASRMICGVFKHSPVFRIGGDEFVVFLEGEDFKNRKILLATFETQIEENLRKGKVVVAYGLANFLPGRDNSYHRIFVRADHSMYDRKAVLKSMEIKTES